MIALITPTGMRPKQIALCVQYMKSQKYDGEVVWVIIDDGAKRSTEDISGTEFLLVEEKPIMLKTFTPTNTFRDKWTILKIYPTPAWEPGQNTQSRNLQIGVDAVKFIPQLEAVFIIEDDDWYSPVYLSSMMEALKGYEIAGEINTIYYNVKDHLIKQNRNSKHSSLFQTCFTPSILPEFEKVLKNNIRFIDIDFFKTKTKINLIQAKHWSIGMKGQPGRAGIGMGHRTSYEKSNQKMTFSKCMELKALIGMDYLNYL